MIGVVKNPARDPLIILTKQGFLTGRDLDLIKVVPCLVSIIDADIEKVGVGFRNIVNEGPGARCIG